MANLAQRQALRKRIADAQTTGVNESIGNNATDELKINTAQLILDRDYIKPPRVGTPERKIYDRLQIAAAEWRDRYKKEIALEEAQLEYKESDEYQNAAEALETARKFADPAVVARLEMCLENASLGIFYQTLGQASDEFRAKRSAELEQIKQVEADLRMKTIEAERDLSNADVLTKMSQYERGINEQEPTQ